MNLAYSHVDVFSQSPFGGNSLPVFPDARDLSAEQMLRITQEMRHFEAIFLEQASQPATVHARIFDLFDEFTLRRTPDHWGSGGLATLGQTYGAQSWRFQLPGKTVTSRRRSPPDATPACWTRARRSSWARRMIGVRSPLHSISRRHDLASDLPMEVVSTGLRYLIVPVRAGALVRARISRDITDLLRGANAQFAVLLDESAVEMRHWNNDGIIEDVATGSAAGTIGAYRLRHGLVRGGDTFILNQGQFTGRPSKLRVLPEGTANRVETVKVGGDVAFVGHGTLEALP